MKKYIGTKTVMAEPMGEAEAIEKGFARPIDDGNLPRQGYHVQYDNPDGSKYDSWSPKDVFEASYNVAETYIDRMKIELSELKDKYLKGFGFLYSESGMTLQMHEKNALEEQLECMRRYIRILTARIDMALSRVKMSDPIDDDRAPMSGECCQGYCDAGVNTQQL